MRKKLFEIYVTIEPLAKAIRQHKILNAITSIEKLRQFSELYVYVIWEFVYLLQALQRKLSSMQTLKSQHLDLFGYHYAHLLLTQEENGCPPTSRFRVFELFLEAMRQCGANTQPITTFMENLQLQLPVSNLLAQETLPKPAKRFITDTFDMLDKESHVLAAILAFAHEYVTSCLFKKLLHHIPESNAAQNFRNFLQCYLDLEANKNHRQFEIMLWTLYEAKEFLWKEALDCAYFSLKSHFQLLDGICAQIMP